MCLDNNEIKANSTFLDQYANVLLDSVPVLQVIGGGKMAEVLVERFVNEGFFLKKNIFVCVKSQKTVEKWNNNGYVALKSNIYYFNVVPKGIILICVKPQVFLSNIYKDICNWLRSDKKANFFVISVMAGITLQKLSNLLNENVIRMMPNVACETGNGSVLVTSYDSFEQFQIKLNKNYDEIETIDELKKKIKLTVILCSKLGYCLEINESAFDVAAAISGSGPAFIFLIMEALADGGVLCGLNRDIALKLLANTVKGSAELFLKTEKSLELLKANICSPGGTTIAGVRELEKAGVRSALIEAIFASKKRSEELSLQ